MYNIVNWNNPSSCCYQPVCRQLIIKPKLPVFRIQNIVSNQTDVAIHEDGKLINPIGIVIIDKIIWVSDHNTDLITSYDLAGNKISSTAIIPHPMGLTRNYTHNFLIDYAGRESPSTLLIASKNGTIYGYNPSVSATHAVAGISNENDVYTGITTANNNAYATDFRNGRIDVVDANFLPVTLPFGDPIISNPVPSDYGPFNIVNLSNLLYVLYAKRDPNNHSTFLSGIGNGFINVYTSNLRINKLKGKMKVKTCISKLRRDQGIT
jgi:uncharacterized protein (TIGR03118 family)